MRLAIASRKGGTGKTTLAAHLLAALNEDDGGAVGVDADPQGSFVRWGGGEHGTVHTLPYARQSARAVAGLERVGAGKRHVVVDTCPALGELEQTIIGWADFVLVPVRPSGLDLESAIVTARECTERGTPFAFVIWNSPSERRAKDAQKLLRDNGLPVCAAWARSRVAFVNAMTDRRVVRSHREFTARREVDALVSELRQLAARRPVDTNAA